MPPSQKNPDRNWNHVVDARSGPGIKSTVSETLSATLPDIFIFCTISYKINKLHGSM